MTEPEKTVFVSYRISTSKMIAAYIDQYLRGHGYDVFRDVRGIDSGDFAQVILNQIAARMHFVVVIAPGSLVRCSEPGDWVRQEIEQAMALGRNIVPILAEGFDFGSDEAKSHLTGALAQLPKYNAVKLYYEYLDEGLDRLRTRFLKVPDFPVTIQPATREEQRRVTQEQARVELAPTAEQLTAEEYFNKAMALGDDSDEEIRLYSEALRLEAGYSGAFINRGTIHHRRGDYARAIDDYNAALKLDAQIQVAYLNRGAAQMALGSYDAALADFDTAIALDRDDSLAWSNRGELRFLRGELDDADIDFKMAHKLDPQSAYALAGLAVTAHAQRRYHDARAWWDALLRVDARYADFHHVQTHLDWQPPLILEAQKILK